MKIRLRFSLLLLLFVCLAQAATPPNVTITYPTPWCTQSGDLHVVLIGTTGGTFSASPGLAIDPVTGTISTGQSAPGAYTVTYTIPSTPEDPAFVCTTMVVLLPTIVPTFSIPVQYCLGSDIPSFPITSDNGITGTWSPAMVSNQFSGTYTFTPTPGQCATVATVFIEIVQTVQPQFGFNGNNFCLDAVPVLPTTSLNGINGTWSPSVIEATGDYIFTPNPGECGVLRSEYFIVNPLPTATITATSPVCQGQSSIVTITGIPGAIVTYTINSGAFQTVVLDPSGVATLATPTLTANTLYCLVSASSGGTQGCTTSLSGCSVINVIPALHLQPMPDVTVCGHYSLPALQTGNYYTQPNGAGLMLNYGDNIFQTQTIYVYAESACGPVQDEFVVTIIPVESPTVTAENSAHYIYIDGTTIVQPLLLDAQVAGNHAYQWMDWDIDIPGANSPTFLLDYHNDQFDHYISVRITNNDTGCVATSALYEVWEVPVPAPVGDPNQTFTLGQTLADVVVYGQNIQWYDSLNRGLNSVPLPLSTVLQEGVTYYATQTINGHESPSAFSITIQFLATDSFAFRDLKFAPNPVGDFLQLSSKDKIQKVTVFNLMGQKILQQNISNLEFSLPMSQLKAGNYFVKLESDNKSQVIKIIKE